jgi:predicted TIM-barrel fold metal-dependent hydrolase
MSQRLLSSLPFRFMRWKFGLTGQDEATERALERKVVETLHDTPQLDAAVVLAFDAVHTPDGMLDVDRTHLYVTNDYAMELARRHRKLLFGASVHPFRRDAVLEIERCVAAGAVLMKWLPITQGFDPADERCAPFYEALAHYQLPLLSHTGGEQSLPQLRSDVADPMRLVPALRRGVTVIAAHCGTRSRFRERDYLPEFMQLAREYEHLYGDTSALSLPSRWHAYAQLLADPIVRNKLIHGSDWPILPLPPLRQLGWGQGWELLSDDNWLRRDVLIKRRLGFDEAYWRRGGEVLRLNR